MFLHLSFLYHLGIWANWIKLQLYRVLNVTYYSHWLQLWLFHLFCYLPLMHLADSFWPKVPMLLIVSSWKLINYLDETVQLYRELKVRCCGQRLHHCLIWFLSCLPFMYIKNGVQTKVSKLYLAETSELYGKFSLLCVKGDNNFDCLCSWVISSWYTKLEIGI